MNYEEMSDFEINRLVALAIGMKVKSEFDETHGFTKKYHEQYPNTIWAARCDGNGNQIDVWEQKIFTNSPEDAWPIIVDNEINIEFLDGGYVDVSINAEFGTFTNDDIYPKEKLCRAAVICFLKMKDSEK